MHFLSISNSIQFQVLVTDSKDVIFVLEKLLELNLLFTDDEVHSDSY